MPSNPTSSRLMPLRRLRQVILCAALVALLSIMGGLAYQVQTKLTALERADSDNGQWAMMQTEVEALRLQIAVTQALNDGPIDEVRRWYNVLYARLALISDTALYANFIIMPENTPQITAMQAYLDRWMPQIDGPDDGLTAALPQMDAEIGEVLQNARALSLNSLISFSDSTDLIRTRVTEALMGLGITTAATFVLLLIVMLQAMRLHRRSSQQAFDIQIAGQRLQMIIASSPDAIIVTNRAGWLVEFNPAAEQMFGWRREQVIGRQIVPIIFARENHSAYQARLNRMVGAALGQGPQRFELEGKRKDGSCFPVEISIASRDMDRDALIVGFLRDVSARNADQLALEQALSRAQAGEKAKAEFLAVMSHEMRTPLNGLIGSMELLHTTPLSADQHELMRAMEISGDILLGHVNSVLDISQIEAGEIRLSYSYFDLDQLIDDCIRNQAGLAKAGHNEIRYLPLEGDLGIVEGDYARLRQILLNLIGNAVKFTRNGEIIIEAERLPPARGSGEVLTELRVTDTGIGMIEEDLSRIFEDFEQLDSSYGRQSGGTGLGLGITRRLVHAMGGTIGVESVLGEGSVFWVRLPLAAVAAEDAAPQTNALLPYRPLSDRGATTVPGLKILVIEDNEINRFLLRRQLQDAGHFVTEARDGLEGVRFAQAEKFDLILTDISMPQLDGVAATQRIRAEGASAKARIVALTAHALPHEVESFHRAGMDACLTKPITRERLMAALSTEPLESDVPSQTATLHPASALEMDDIERKLHNRMEELSSQLSASLLRDLLEKFIAEADAVIALIPRPVTAENIPFEIHPDLHRLAGTSAVFGAVPLQQTVSATETALKLQEVDRALTLLKIVPHLWQFTRVILEKHHARLAESHGPAESGS